MLCLACFLRYLPGQEESGSLTLHWFCLHFYHNMWPIWSHLTKNCFVFTFSVERPSPAEADLNLKKYNPPPPPPHLLWACPDAPQWDLTPHRTGLQEASNSPPALPASHVQTFVLFLFVFLFLFGWIIMLAVPEETLTINGKRAFLALHS